MKYFAVCFCSMLAAVTATPTGGYYYAAPTAGSPLLLSGFSTALASPIQQQYFNQDSLGQYSYGYSEPLSSKQEVRTHDGVTRGSYSYRDADGKVQTVDYIADVDGFRVAATNLPLAAHSGANELPQPVTETPEVAEARAQHLAAYKAVEMRLAAQQLAAGEQPSSILKASSLPALEAELPQSVADTAEVAAAKLQFFKSYAQEEQRHQLLRKQHKSSSFAKYALLRSQPIVAAPLSLSYHSAFVPSSAALQLGEHIYLPVHSVA